MAALAASPPPYEDTQRVPRGPSPGTGPSYPQAGVQYPLYSHQGAILPPQPYVIPTQSPQVQYVVASGFPTVPTVISAPKAPFPGPHSFVVYTLIVGIICTIIHPPSIIFAIPAFALVGLSESKKDSHQFSAASRLAKYAVALTTITLVFTALAWLLYIGLIIYLTSGCRFIVYESSDGGYRCSQ